MDAGFPHPDQMMSRIFEGIALLPSLVETISRLEARIDSLTRTLNTKQQSARESSDPWMDSKAARKYLGNMSEATFDKYLHKTTPKIEGHKLDGKTYFKRSELDRFVRLYELKSQGLA